MGFLVLFVFVNCMVCVFGQYVNYPSNYGGNYRGYQVAQDNGYYQPNPSQSCGNYRQISYCHRLPCYTQQPYHIPYAYQNSQRQVAYPYQQVLYPNSRSSSSSYSDPYANVPVEIIDEEDAPNIQVPNRPPNGQNILYAHVPAEINRPSNNGQNIYANVPTEIIDDSNIPIQWSKIPRLPKFSRSTQSNYSVSYGEITSKTQSQNPPIRATVTRSFPPRPQDKPEITLDFLNGALVSKSETTIQTTTPEEAIITTETPTTTTEENEEVPEVKSWF